MATVKITASNYSRSSSSYVTLTNVQNMYTDVDSTTEGVIRGRTRNQTTYYFFLHDFDFSQVPSDATVNSFTIRIRAYREQYTSTGSNYRIRLASRSSSSRAIANTTVTSDLTTSAATYVIPHVGLDWATMSGYGNAFCIEIPIRNSSTSSGRYPYIHVLGAEIEVDYTPAGPSGPDMYSNYYIQISHGGWSPCVEGNNDYGLLPFSGSVLPNCSGWATGRFNEILNLGACTWLGNWNGGDFLYYAQLQGLPCGTDPVVGGAMVWRNSGEGHVAIVEQIISPTEVICSESGWYWTSPPVWDYKTHYYNYGRWHSNPDYIYQGCIYPPGTPPGPLPDVGDDDEYYYIMFMQEK